VKSIILGALLALGSTYANAKEHPYVRFENGFNRLLNEMAWQEWTPKERQKHVRAIWRGSGKCYDIAALAAAVGVMEHHWALPPPDRYVLWRGKCYEKVRGHLGCHNGTLWAEVKRRKSGGSREMWLRYWKRDTANADFYGASRLAFIVRVYKDETVGLKQWVTGDAWRTNPSEAKRAETYAANVQRVKNRFFK
jgi:hypothetical protein